MQRSLKKCSFPGSIGSQATPERPGSIHEGSELVCSVSHACETANDHADPVKMVDGESPLGTSWHSNKHLRPIADGPLLPVLYLNATSARSYSASEGR